MATVSELIEEARALGKEVPGNLTRKRDIEEYLAAVKSGYTDEELQEAFGSVPAGGDAPGYTDQDMKNAVDEAVRKERLSIAEQVKEEVAKALAAGHGAPAGNQTTINVSQPKAKPVVWDTRNTEEGDFLEVPFAVYHVGGGYTFDKFKIGGRLVESPFSTLIEFRQYEGPETQGVGLGQDLSHLCVHYTHSKTVRDMFIADERWGGDFWTTEHKVMDEELERGILFAQISDRLRGVNQVQLREMCRERGIPNSSLDEMRARIAMHDTKASVEQRKLDRAGLEALDEKQKLMVTA